MVAFSGIRVVDTDTHLTEPHDLWTRQAPAARRDEMPHVADVDGEATWVIGDDVLGRAGGGGVIGRDGSKINAQTGLFEWSIDDIHLGAHDPVARLEMMDEMGIWTEVLYPNVIGLGGQGIADVVKDEPFRLLLLQMYNDHMAGVQEQAGHRLLPMGVLPSWSVDACVAEARRLHGMGFRGVNMTSDPQDLGAPDLAQRAWDPLWATCAELELPVHFHIGASLTTMNFYGSYPWPSQQEDVALGIGGTLLFIGNARVVVNVICSGLLDRHPTLKMVSVESGCGWIPFILEALDYEMDENAPHLVNELSLRPSEYFTRQFYATTWFERADLANVVERVGEDNIMFETDFPHPTCLFPDPLETASRNMAGLSPEVQRKILSDNAVRLYRL
ncbi:MAG TPA: amidohydrolase family protein [Acidimicrobiales bacterium]|nr:amidohydrolase family protein [Acidimicrobiales bacterium]